MKKETIQSKSKLEEISLIGLDNKSYFISPLISLTYMKLDTGALNYLHRSRLDDKYLELIPSTTRVIIQLKVLDDFEEIDKISNFIPNHFWVEYYYGWLLLNLTYYLIKSRSI